MPEVESTHVRQPFHVSRGVIICRLNKGEILLKSLHLF